MKQSLRSATLLAASLASILSGCYGDIIETPVGGADGSGGDGGNEHDASFPDTGAGDSVGGASCIAAGGGCAFFGDDCGPGYFEGGLQDCPVDQNMRCCIPAPTFDGGGDAEIVDAGHEDIGTEDAGTPDGGHDAGTPDAGHDAGSVDVGPPPSCGQTWTLTEYLSGHGVNSLATNGSIYVAAGECYTQNAALDCGAPDRFGGLIMTSADGLTNWQVQQSKAPLSLKDIVYAKGLFVAVGNKKLIVTSPDGITWTQQQYGTPTDPAFAAIVHDGTKFVAVGTAGFVQTSMDAVTWTDHGTAANMNFSHLALGGGRFVGVGSGGWAAVSTDGITWTTAQIPGAGNLYNVTYGAGKFIAGGQDGLSYYSADAKTWTRTNSPYENYWQGGTYVEPCGLFIIALGRTPDADNAVLVSPDGINFEKVFLKTTAVHGQLNVHYDGRVVRTFGGYTSMHWSACSCP